MQNKKNELFERIILDAEEYLDEKLLTAFKHFISRYFLSISYEDMASKSYVDLYGSVLSHWNFFLHNSDAKLKLEIYNPNFDSHGWSSSYTCVQILHSELPFLLSSIRMSLRSLSKNIAFINYISLLKVKRDSSGKVIEILDYESEFLSDADSANDIDNKDSDSDLELLSEKNEFESVLFMEIEKVADIDSVNYIKSNILKVVQDNRLCANDWLNMQDLLQMAIKDVEHYNQDKLLVDYLKWLLADNFIFVAAQRFIINNNESPARNMDKVLGLFKGEEFEYIVDNDLLEKFLQPVASGGDLLLLGKCNIRSVIHRNDYYDFIIFKVFDETNVAVMEYRFIGLYTSQAYQENLDKIPFISDKIRKVHELADFKPNSYAVRLFKNIISNLPRDELFQASSKEIFDLTLQIYYIHERDKIKIFLRQDRFNHYFSCFLFIPRDMFNSDVRMKIERILRNDLHGISVSYDIYFSSSMLARIHYIVRTKSNEAINFDLKTLEESIENAVLPWEERLYNELLDQNGLALAALYINKYRNSFPLAYQDRHLVRNAGIDISNIEKLYSLEDSILISVYKNITDASNNIRIKLYHKDSAVHLSEIVPILENAGLKVENENTYHIKDFSLKTTYIHELTTISEFNAIDVISIKHDFEQMLTHVWNKKISNDRLNRLVLSNKLHWHEVNMLRAYNRYLWQIGFVFSKNTVEEALIDSKEATSLLVSLFLNRFDFHSSSNNLENIEVKSKLIEAQIELALNKIESLDTDRIIRRYLEVIKATVRTNYFFKNTDGSFLDYISFKINPRMIADISKPVPMHEIFVYSVIMEGVHLRFGSIARGGIRFSDRKDDYRVEVLGLAKTQTAKNSLIVPSGSKGGFIVKNINQCDSPEVKSYKVEQCYTILIKGMLDITDNLIENDPKPAKGISFDNIDPYLVVAADKGTANFSDLANSISQDYNFWLDDGFASGGCTGYDHKKIGITAKGAWESVRCHFRRLNKNPDIDEFTVIGIGDMAGDVFGNGMLLSNKIKLLAAFNHKHIFLDPNPDVESSFAERKRLFALNRSNWSDYDQSVLSAGGRIYDRSQKSLILTPEIKKLLCTEKNQMFVSELIHNILCLNCDLLFNGGIGTFIKSSAEDNSNVGDRTNDQIRVDANKVRAKIIAEGGNLGITQLGRIEFSSHGGLINTDAIDNSAGVDCSDHEVNLKILLSKLLRKGDITLTKRNSMLLDFTDEIVDLVLTNNRSQNLAISMSESLGVNNVKLYKSFADYLEESTDFNKELEFIANDELLQERLKINIGFTRPELCVMHAYAKINLKQNLESASFFDNAYINKYIFNMIPDFFRNNYREDALEHPLAKQMAITYLSSKAIDDMGMEFAFRLLRETNASAEDLILNYILATDILQIDHIRSSLLSLPELDLNTHINILLDMNRAIRRIIRWLLQKSESISASGIDQYIANYQKKLYICFDIVLECIDKIEQKKINAIISKYMLSGIDSHLSSQIAKINHYSVAMIMISEISINLNIDIEKVSELYFAVEKRLNFEYLRKTLLDIPVENNWDALARAAIRDDIDAIHSKVVSLVIVSTESNSDEENQTTNDKIEDWVLSCHALVLRYESFVAQILESEEKRFLMFQFAIRELYNIFK